MNRLTKDIDAAKNGESKLILIIGKPGSGKSKLIHEYSEETGIPIIDLDNIFKGKVTQIESVMHDFLTNYDNEVLLLDNKKILYAKNSNIDMLAFLKELTKKVIVVATWNGTITNNKLIHIRSKLPTNLEYNLDNENIKLIEC